MANPYFNPSSMFQNDWKPSGGLGGYLAGLQNSYTEEYAKRGLQSSDQAMEMDKLKLEQLRAEGPSKQSKWDLEALENEAKASTYRDGSAQQFMRDKMVSETEVGRGNAAKAISQQDDLKGKFMVEFSEGLKGTDRSKLDMAFWDHWREKAKRAGVKMPTVMSDEDIERTHKNAQGYIRTAEFQRAQMLAADHDKAQATARAETAAEGAKNRAFEGSENRASRETIAAAQIAGRQATTDATQTGLNDRARERAELVRETKMVKETLENHLVEQLRTIPKGTAAYENAVDKAMPMLYSLETKLDLNAIGEDVTAQEARKKKIKDRWMTNDLPTKAESTSSPKSAPTGGPTLGDKKTIKGKSYTLVEKNGKKGWLED